jgi:hypothetical protein
MLQVANQRRETLSETLKTNRQAVSRSITSSRCLSVDLNIPLWLSASETSYIPERATLTTIIIVVTTVNEAYGKYAIYSVCSLCTTKPNDKYDNVVNMRPSPIICATAMSVRLDSRTLGALEVLRPFPAIEMSPMLILPPPVYVHRFRGRRKEVWCEPRAARSAPTHRRKKRSRPNARLRAALRMEPPWADRADPGTS